jgi:hypothetical protein
MSVMADDDKTVQNSTVTPPTAPAAAANVYPNFTVTATFKNDLVSRRQGQHFVCFGRGPRFAQPRAEPVSVFADSLTWAEQKAFMGRTAGEDSDEMGLLDR